jgi:6-phosphogluconolactonase
MPTGMQHCSEAERQAAAETYSDSLPDSFDLVHLGLGADGHTASLVPGDPLLEENTGLVGCTCVYQGHHRMTLTYPALRRARSLMWLVAGAEKTSALASLLHGDTTIPAGRVVAGESVVMADAAALGREHT